MVSLTASASVGISGSLNARLGDCALSAQGTIEQVLKAVQASESIPKEVKPAIRDFLNETWEEVVQNLPDISDIQVPDTIVDYWDIVVEFILKILS